MNAAQDEGKTRVLSGLFRIRPVSLEVVKKCSPRRGR